MQTLLEMLRKRILPLVRKEPGRILVPGEAPFLEAIPDLQTHFIEAYRPQHHSHFEVMWLLRGTAHLQVEGRIYEVAAGDLCFLPPFISHADVYERRTPEYESIWFSYTPGTMGAAHFLYKPFGKCKAHSLGRISTGDEILSVFLALQREGLRHDEFKEEATHALILQFAITLIRTLEGKGKETLPPAEGELASRVQRYLEENYSREVSLKNIAEMLALSPNYVATLFKAETGQTIVEALTAIRMRHAVRLLLQDGLPVKQVAKSVGYGSAEHFSRTFRRINGVSPTRYGRREGSVRHVMKSED